MEVEGRLVNGRGVYEVGVADGLHERGRENVFGAFSNSRFKWNRYFIKCASTTLKITRLLTLHFAVDFMDFLVIWPFRLQKG